MKRETKQEVALYNKSILGTVFAKQKKLTRAEKEKIHEGLQFSHTPILVGIVGEKGRDIVDILQDNHQLRIQVELLQKEQEENLAIIRQVKQVRLPWWK